MQRANILLVEDNNHEAVLLSCLLNKLGYNVVGICENGREALSVFYSKEPDIILIDVHLNGEMDGIQVAEKINFDLINRKPFIFLTIDNDNETYQRAKKTNPCSYLIKPYDSYTLQYSIDLALYCSNPAEFNKVREDNAPKGEDFIYIKKTKKIIKVRVTDILYAQVESNYSTLVTMNGKFTLQTSLNELQNHLPAKLFLRIHRNYIANLSAVSEFNFEEYTVKVSEKTLPIGKKYKPKITGSLTLLH